MAVTPRAVADDRVVTYAWVPADGHCQQLTAPFSGDFVPFITPDAFGQFLDYLPPD